MISENRLTPIPKEISFKDAALLGCAIPTGLGVVFNTAKPKHKESLAVFGCGGIGLCAIQGAVIAGCFPVIAIDLNLSKLEAAKAMGASHVIDAQREDPVEALKKLGPLDYAIEASGSPIAMNQALQAVRSQGGTAIIVGNAKHGQQISIDPKELNQGKKILGTWGGDNDPDTHYPHYCTLIRDGRFNPTLLTSDTYSLSQIDTALAHLEQGQVLRPLIEMGK